MIEIDKETYGTKEVNRYKTQSPKTQIIIVKNGPTLKNIF